jgi:hypothetical protein
MKHASYREAVAWIAGNDGTEWLGDGFQQLDSDMPVLSVTAALVADIFDVTEEKLIADLRSAIARLYADS